MKNIATGIEGFIYYTPFYIVTLAIIVLLVKVAMLTCGWTVLEFGVLTTFASVAFVISAIVMYSCYFDYNSLNNDEDRDLTGAVSGWISIVFLIPVVVLFSNQ